MKDQCYQFLKNEIGKTNIVGFGSYGEVKIARNTDSNQIVAIKLVHHFLISKQIHGKNAKQQIDVHHKLNHPNIIKLLNYYYQKDRNITYMVLEYAQNGSLNEKIKFGLGQLSKQLIRKYFKNICQAIRYLHKNNYMHRDIKPQNILITKDNVAKLCDFGFAAIFQARTTMCGTFQYMAPQMIKKKHYNYKIDIWALGILLFEMIQGLAPFRGDTGQQVLTQMKRPIKFSQRFDSLEIDLIKKILRVSPQNRPSVDEILQHAYFKQLKDEQYVPIKALVFAENKNPSSQQEKIDRCQNETILFKQRLNSSKEKINKIYKNPQNKFNPMQVSQIQKPRSPILNHYASLKNETNVPNFIQNNQLNKSFKTKDTLLRKNQQSDPIDERQSRKYSTNNVGLFSPQNQKKNLSPANNSKTQTKQDKISEFFTKPQEKKVFTTNWSLKTNISTQNNKAQNSNKSNNEEVGFNNKKTSITGKVAQHTTTATTGSPPYRFLNKSFKDLKSAQNIQQQKDTYQRSNNVKTQPHSQGAIMNNPSTNARKNVNFSISAVNSSFNHSNSRVSGQYQSPNSSFNIYPQSHQQNIGLKAHGSGEHHFSPTQMINFQKPINGNINSHKQLNMSMLKEGSKS